MGYENFWAFRAGMFEEFYHEWVPRAGTTEAIRDFVAENSFQLTRQQAGAKHRVAEERRYVPKTAKQKAAEKKLRAELARMKIEPKAQIKAMVKPSPRIDKPMIFC